jgi:hypothetical protein
VALVFARAHAEQHEVSTLMTASRHMQRKNPFTDLAPLFRTTVVGPAVSARRAAESVSA